MEFIRDNWFGGLLALFAIFCGVGIARGDGTQYSPSKRTILMHDLGGPDYCMVDIDTSRTDEQIKLDMEWCLKSAREKRKQEGRP